MCVSHFQHILCVCGFEGLHQSQISYKDFKIFANDDDSDD